MLADFVGRKTWAEDEDDAMNLAAMEFAGAGLLLLRMRSAAVRVRVLSIRWARGRARNRQSLGTEEPA